MLNNLRALFQMMDSTSFGFVAIIAVLITVISIIVFKMFPKETDFEKVCLSHFFFERFYFVRGKRANCQNVVTCETFIITREFCPMFFFLL